MKHWLYAETKAEAEAIIEHLENWYDNYTGSIYAPTLLVTWLDENFDNADWERIYEATLEKLEGTTEYDELLEQGCL